MKTFMIIILLFMFGVPGLWAYTIDTGPYLDDEDAPMRRETYSSPQNRPIYQRSRYSERDEGDCPRGMVYINYPGRIIKCFPEAQKELIMFKIQSELQQKQQEDQMVQRMIQESIAEDQARAQARQAMLQNNQQFLDVCMQTMQKLMPLMGVSNALQGGGQ